MSAEIIQMRPGCGRRGPLRPADRCEPSPGAPADVGSPAPEQCRAIHPSRYQGPEDPPPDAA